jgi:hypothetical protein
MSEQEQVQKYTKLINQICGLDENWAKTCIYYCSATHWLSEINWMAVLQFIGESGSGKSNTMTALERMAYEPCLFSCDPKMTSVSLRNKLTQAKNATAFIEEADLYPNRKELEAYIINRVSRLKTSGISRTIPSGERGWITVSESVFGATVIHDRYPLVNLAALRRAITVPITKYKDRKFLNEEELKPLLSDIHPVIVPLGKIPEAFESPKTSGSGLDAWKPLIRIASSLQDSDWLIWAWSRVAEVNETLADERQWELEICIFRSLVAAYTEHSQTLNKKDPLPLTSITPLVKAEYTWVVSQHVAKNLRKLGFMVTPKSGINYVFTDLEQIRKVGKEIGYVDTELYERMERMD